MRKYIISLFLVGLFFIFGTHKTHAAILFNDPVSGAVGTTWNVSDWDYHSLYGIYDTNGAHGKYYPWKDFNTQDQVIKWTYHYGNQQDILSIRCRISYDGLNTEQVTIYPDMTGGIDEGVNGSYVNRANFSPTTTGTVNGELACIGDTLTYKENGVVKASYTMNSGNTATGVAFYSSGDGHTSISDIYVCDASGCGATPTPTIPPTPTASPSAAWQKHPNNPIYTGGTTWGTNIAVTPIVLKINNVYKMWYVGNNGSFWRIGYATSANGISNWTTAATDVIPVGTPDGWEKEVIDPSVIYDNGVYKMWYISSNPSLGPAGPDRWRVRYATSTNGINWTPTTGWVMHGTAGKWDEGGMNRGMTVLKINGTYRMWYAATNTNDLTVNPYWRIGYATSPDGITWTKQNNGNPIIEPTESWEGDNVSGPNVIYEGGTYKMWYEKRNGDQPTNQLVYATSTDGINWTKPANMNPALNSSAGFDSQQIFTPFVMHDGNEYKMWYGGYNGQLVRIGLATQSLPANITPVVSSISGALIHTGDNYSASGSFTDSDSTTWDASVDYGDGTGVQVLTLNSNKTFSLNHMYAQAGSYTVTVTVTDDFGASGTKTTLVNVVKQLTSVSPATVWVKTNLPALVLKLDLKAEVYKDSTLVTSGQINSVGPGTTATAQTIPFTSFSPVDFPSGSQLKMVVYARNACSGSILNSGTATLYYNNVSTDSSFDATLDTTNTYHLLDGFVLGATAGSTQKSINVAAGARCSAFKPFGTWTVTP